MGGSCKLEADFKMFLESFGIEDKSIEKFLDGGERFKGEYTGIFQVH